MEVIKCIEQCVICLTDNYKIVIIDKKKLKDFKNCIVVSVDDSPGLI